MARLANRKRRAMVAIVSEVGGIEGVLDIANSAVNASETCQWFMHDQLVVDTSMSPVAACSLKSDAVRNVRLNTRHARNELVRGCRPR